MGDASATASKCRRSASMRHLRLVVERREDQRRVGAGVGGLAREGDGGARWTRGRCPPAPGARRAAPRRADERELLLLVEARRLAVGSQDEIPGEVGGGVRLEVALERGEVERAAGEERRDQGRDDAAQGGRGQAAGVFRASAATTLSISLTSWLVNASRKSLQTSRIAHRPASVRIGDDHHAALGQAHAPPTPGCEDRSETTLVRVPVRGLGQRPAARPHAGPGPPAAPATCARPGPRRRPRRP